MWSCQIANSVRPHHNTGTDRMCMIEITQEGGRKLFVISVYLPYQGCTTSNFHEEINVLENIISEYSEKGSVVVIGDINVHMGSEYGVRGWGVTYPNGHAYMRAMQRCDMSVVDIGEKGSGPIYTFHNSLGVSYIDHCAVSNCILPEVQSCSVIDDEIRNVSDHLPLTVSIAVSCITGKQGCVHQQVAWHKLTQDQIYSQYTEPLEEQTKLLLTQLGVESQDILENQSSGINSKNINTEHVAQRLTEMFIYANSQLPQTKYNKHMKPYWDGDLTILSRTEKLKWQQWVHAGRPRDPQNELYIQYKDAKRHFRAAQRRKIADYENKCMGELAQTQEIDQRFFWYTVNKKRKKVYTVSPIHNETGDIVTEPSEIRREWNAYYQRLYTAPVENTTTLNAGFDKYVNEQLAIYDSQNNNIDELEDGPVTTDEVKKEICKMKTRKAPGWDRVTAENLKHGGEILISTIAWLINNIALKERIPVCYKRGLIVPIPKPSKDQTVQDNNRGITLLPVLYKLLERILLTRERHYFTNHDVVDEIQGAGQEKCSCLHTSLLLQETIAENTIKGATVYVAFLDIKKAFDMVWIPGLMYKLCT